MTKLMQVMMPLLLKMTGGQVPGLNMNSPFTSTPNSQDASSAPSTSTESDTMPVPQSVSNTQPTQTEPEPTQTEPEPTPEEEETDEDELTPEEIEQRKRRKAANKLREAGNAEFKAGNLDQALKLYQEGHNTDPKNPVYSCKE